MASANVPQLVRGSELVQGEFSMSVSFVALAAAAAAQAAAPQSVVAQVAPAAPQAVIVSPVTQNVLRAGTEVPLRLEQGLDSNDKALREGQQVRMSVVNDVRLGNVVVIPAGS